MEGLKWLALFMGFSMIIWIHLALFMKPGVSEI